MIKPALNEPLPHTLYHIVSDQPDCCPTCQTRLDLLEVVMIDEERVFKSFCETCQRKFLLVES